MQSNNQRKILVKIAATLTVSVLSLIMVSSFPGSVQGASTTATGYCSSAGTTMVGGSSSLGDVMKFISCLIQNSVVPLVFAIALVSFIWGVVKFIQSKDAGEREEGQQFMLWGIVGLAVMLSVWGLVKILGDTFKVGNVVPQLPITPK